MKILFLLRRDRLNAKGECTIVCRITINGTRCTPFSTNVFCKPENFNTKLQSIKGDELGNISLENIKQKLKMIHLINEQKGQELTADNLKQYYLGKRPLDITLTFLMTKYLEHRFNLHKIGEITYVTYMRDEYFATNLKLFLKAQSINMITPKEITPKIMMDFFYWVQNSKQASRTYAVKISYTLKALINYAVIEGYAPYNPLLSVKLKKGAKKEPEALSPDQVEILYNYKFDVPVLQKVADYALLQCYTGLAYSDLKEFDPFKHIEVDPKYGEFINKNRKKTDTKSLLPLLPRAKEIINKYIVFENGETKFTLKIMANSLYNQYLKVIESKLNFGVHFTTHICRRTYGALRLDSGVDIFRVSKEMGHKNIQETIDNYAVLLRKLEISKEK